MNRKQLLILLLFGIFLVPTLKADNVTNATNSTGGVVVINLDQSLNLNPNWMVQAYKTILMSTFTVGITTIPTVVLITLILLLVALLNWGRKGVGTWGKISLSAAFLTILIYLM